ncbi:ribonuclease HI family protein [Desemzia sp. RIT804]|uniref:ribonuclease HI family protein n=1 Tax=Desemzia sp. RIT 804 TaxID=2810209 RepID=UPI00194DD35D|nr:ribonuclease HI family protein [Desemzia sp. RIT 804]MBM6613743.1 ribonuclease HI family protein [Desemzia sp. RIT 804]
MIKIYTDAATKGNPGPSGIGFVLVGENLYQQIAIPLEGIYSNHEAEFIALVKGLTYLVDHKMNKELLQIFSDSKIVVSALEKNYVKNETFKPHLQQLKLLLNYFEMYLIEWIPDAKNKGADNLARQALRKALLDSDSPKA